MKLRNLGALAGAIVLVASACNTPAASVAPSGSPSAAPKGTIKIFSSLPRQGSSKGQTDTIVNAEKLALTERNNTAGGYTIEFVDGDDSTAEAGQWTAAKEIENAVTASNDEDVIGYLGTFNSGAAKVSIPINCGRSLVMISPANTYPGLTKPGKGATGEPDVYYPGCAHNYFRVVPADDLQGLAGAKWAKTLGLTQVYIVDDSQLYGKGIADVFEAEAAGQGLTVLGHQSILGTETDYQSLASTIAGTNPTLVYFGGITQQNAGQLWRDVKAAMPTVAMMGPDGIFEDAFITAAGADIAEGTYITFGGLPADQLTGKGATFVTNFTAAYGALQAYTAYGYEAMNVLLDAIDTAGATNPADRGALRAAVLAAVAATKDYDGVLGKWSFDANGDTSLTGMSGNAVEGGAFVFKTVIP